MCIKLGSLQGDVIVNLRLVCCEWWAKYCRLSRELCTCDINTTAAKDYDIATLVFLPCLIIKRIESSGKYKLSRRLSRWTIRPFGPSRNCVAVAREVLMWFFWKMVHTETNVYKWLRQITGSLSSFWRSSFAGDWIFLALLGVITAMIGYFMDYVIGKCFLGEYTQLLYLTYKNSSDRKTIVFLFSSSHVVLSWSVWRTCGASVLNVGWTFRFVCAVFFYFCDFGRTSSCW